jgi:sensor histidine kinase YesM
VNILFSQFSAKSFNLYRLNYGISPSGVKSETDLRGPIELTHLCYEFHRVISKFNSMLSAFQMHLNDLYFYGFLKLEIRLKRLKAL